MELTSLPKPFVYVPIGNHFEQNRLAAATAEEINRPVTSTSVPTDGARKAAAMLAELLSHTTSAASG
jgi:hypothetical protein